MNFLPPVSKSEKDRIEKLRIRVRSSTHVCYNPSCADGSPAIRSHILQKNGILNKISSAKGMVWQMDSGSLFSHHRTRFKHQHIQSAGSDVLAFWGFCKICDGKIFSEVEAQGPNFSKQRHLLLFSYRALVNELYKQEYNLRHYEIIFASTLNEKIKDYYREKHLQFSASLKLLREYKKELELQLGLRSVLKSFFYYCFSKRRKVHFIVRKCPTLHMAASIIFSTLHEKINAIDIDLDVLSPYFLHIIPTDHGTEVIFGHESMNDTLEGVQFKDLATIPEQQLLQIISHIVIKYAETWAISEKFYASLNSKRITSQIITMKDYFLNNRRMRSKQLSFNIFDYLS